MTLEKEQKEVYTTQDFASRMYFIFMLFIAVLGIISMIIFVLYFNSYEERFSILNPLYEISMTITIITPFVLSFITFLIYIIPMLSYIIGINKRSDGLIDFIAIMKEQSNPTTKKSKIRNNLLAIFIFLNIITIIAAYIYFFIGIFVLV